MSYFQVDSVAADAVDATVDPDSCTAECEQTPPVQVSLCDSKPAVEPSSPPAETGTALSCQSPSVRGGRKSFSSDVCLENEPAAESCVGGQHAVTAPPEEGERTSNSSAPGTEAPQNQEGNSLQSKEEQDKPERVNDPNGDVTPAVGPGTMDSDHFMCGF